MQTDESLEYWAQTLKPFHYHKGPKETTPAGFRGSYFQVTKKCINDGLINCKKREKNTLWTETVFISHQFNIDKKNIKLVVNSSNILPQE